MKFGGHETFHLRDHWIFKGIKMLENHGDIFAQPEKSVEVLGVGTNMVKSIRHWLIATQLVIIKQEKVIKSPFGKLLSHFDPYYAQLGSAWILHYLLSSNKKNATTWFWLFNKFGVSEFTADSAVYHLENYCTSQGKKVNTNTLTRDINTLLRMYVEPEFNGNKTPEDIHICPLSKLSLIKKLSNGCYRIQKPNIDDLPTEIFGYALTQFWINQLGKPLEISFDDLMNRDTSPAKVFCLNPDKVIDLLNRLVELFPKNFNTHRSGGFFTISVHSSVIDKDLIGSYYEKQ